MSGRKRGESGVTLVELLIAVALLGFILLGIAPLFIASVKSNSAGNEYTSIHNLARDRLEQLMNVPFNDPQLVPGVYANDLSPKLPNPLPPATPYVVNPFVRVYQVQEYRIPADDIVTTPANAVFTSIRVTAGGQIYDYKRIDVEVRTVTSLGLGGAASPRLARVSGIVANPSPASNLSAIDPCPSATPFTCS